MINIELEKDMFEKLDTSSGRLRNRFAKENVFALNLMSAPGAGKTTLLTRTLEALSADIRFGIIEGDIQTSIDADRLASFPAMVRQINTDGACHLDPRLIEEEIAHFDLTKTDALIVENVGNLVCPAEFDLGEERRAMLLSVTEGHDKPMKYPLMFQTADVLLINKIDLLPYTDFDLEKAEKVCRELNPKIEIIRISCRTGEGLQRWYERLKRDVDFAKGN